MVGLFLLKLLQLFQHRFLFRGLAARCEKLLLVQHHINILADTFQIGDTLSWEHRGITHTVMGNIPYDEIMKIAEGIR